MKIFQTITITLIISASASLPAASEVTDTQPSFAEDMVQGSVRISFDYNRVDPDFANNQFAVWIEDMEGNLVKTLYVTKFTATRGWKKRKETLPVWKRKAQISELKKKDIDAITGATPKAQKLDFTWEEMSTDGPQLPQGEYRYSVECNYYWEDTVLYSGKILVGSTLSSSTAVAHFSTPSAEQYSIIENVTAEFTPTQR